ncbi:hypothetical protein ACX4MT_06250 [Roseomonas mucosa]
MTVLIGTGVVALTGFPWWVSGPLYVAVVAGLLTWAESLPSPKPARKRVRKAPSARRPGSAAKPRRSKAEAASQALLPAPDKKG